MKKKLLDLLSYPRALILIILMPAVTLLFSAITVLIVVPLRNKVFSDRIVHIWAHTVCFLAGIKIRTIGIDKLKGIQSAVLVSNHLALYDIPVLCAAIPLTFRMAAKAELFDIPLFGRAIRSLGFVPVVREKVAASRETIEKSLEKFKSGESIWMAPEGTRHKGDGVGRFKSGAFYLALEANQPVVPICIFGTHHVLPKHSLLTNWGHFQYEVIVSFLDPIHPTLVSSRHELRDLTRQIIEQEFFDIRNQRAN